jgi:hypothetical protein
MSSLATIPATSIDSFGSIDVVQDVLNRLLKLHPQAEQIGAVGLKAISQIAIAIGANPLPGCNEIHAWVDTKKNGERELKICIGYNYYNRIAELNGGIMWHIQPRYMTVDEKRANDIAETTYAAICSGTSRNAYLQLLKYGLKHNEIMATTAMTGYGIEIVYQKNGADVFETAKSTKHFGWTLNKRAKVDMIKQLFPVALSRFNEAIYAHNVIDGMIISPTTEQPPEIEWTPPSEEFRKKYHQAPSSSTLEELNTLYENGESPSPTPTPTPEPTPTPATTPTPTPATTPTPTPATAPATYVPHKTLVETLGEAYSNGVKPTTHSDLWNDVVTACNGKYTSIYHVKAAIAKHPDWIGINTKPGQVISTRDYNELVFWLVERKKE